jgi:hypothetical protein
MKLKKTYIKQKGEIIGRSTRLVSSNCLHLHALIYKPSVNHQPTNRAIIIVSLLHEIHPPAHQDRDPDRQAARSDGSRSERHLTCRGSGDSHET